MRWNRARRSDNVVDARGRSGMRLGGGLGLGGIAIVVVSKLGAEPAPSIVKRFEEADADYHAG